MQEQERNLAKLSVPRNGAKQRIADQLSKLIEMPNGKPKSNLQYDKQVLRFASWDVYTYDLLRYLFSNDQLAEEFLLVKSPRITNSMSLSEKGEALGAYVYQKAWILTMILERMDLYPESQIDLQMDTRAKAINIVERLAINFPHFVSQLAKRQRRRAPISISDEYDLQDFFVALLKLFFADVRPEEWTPSYAGKSTKMDFLLKSQ